jgi:flagellar operon protein
MADPIRINSSANIRQSEISSAQPQTQPPANGTVFADMLSKAGEVKFSNHAQKRLESRSVEMNQENMARLSSAVDKAKAHGGKESLILMDDLAFIVNVQQRTVVTTVDVNQRSQGVFTKIDSVVIAESNKQ